MDDRKGGREGRSERGTDQISRDAKLVVQNSDPTFELEVLLDGLVEKGEGGFGPEELGGVCQTRTRREQKAAMVRSVKALEDGG